MKVTKKWAPMVTTCAGILLVAIIAQAQNLTVSGTISGNGAGRKYVGSTSAVYNGNLGGRSGGNTKCASQFSGSRMCTVADWQLRPDEWPTSGSGAGWVYGQESCGAGSCSACYQYTSSNSTFWGQAYEWTLGYIHLINCNQNYPVACCK